MAPGRDSSNARRRPWLLAACAGGVLLGAWGCSGPRPWPVTGKVVFADGTPVPSGLVEFEPADGGPAARGKLGPDGRFVLQTGDQPGAVAGKHRIVAVQVLVADGHSRELRAHAQHGPQHQAKVVHDRHRRFDTSGLERVVEAGRDNDLTIEVSAAPSPPGRAAGGW
jgi:hypothetical protein